MKKRRTIIICLIMVLIIVVTAVALQSSLEYKIMAKTEELKNQLYHEHQMYTEQLFERIEVERSWYSLSPEDWTFRVTFASDSETLSYRYADGEFILFQ